MKTVVLIASLLLTTFAYADNPAVLIETLRNHSVGFSSEALRDLETRYASYFNGQYTRTDALNKINSHTRLDLAVVQSGVDVESDDFYESFDLDFEKRIHHVLPELFNREELPKVQVQAKRVRDSFTTMLYLIKKGYSNLAHLEMGYLREDIVKLSKKLNVLKIKKKIKRKILIEIILNSIEVAHAANGPWAQKETYQMDEVLERLRPLLRSQDKWDTVFEIIDYQFKSIGHATKVPFYTLVGVGALLAIPFLVIAIPDLIVDQFTDDYRKSWTIQYIDFFADTSLLLFKPVCAVTAAVSCYYTWGKMKLSPISMPLRKIVDDRKKTCNFVLGKSLL